MFQWGSLGFESEAAIQEKYNLKILSGKTVWCINSNYNAILNSVLNEVSITI